MSAQRSSTSSRRWRLVAIGLTTVVIAFLAGVLLRDSVERSARLVRFLVVGAPDYQGYVRVGGPEGTPQLPANEHQQMEALRGLAYLSGTQPAPDAVGVTVHVPDRVQVGLNLLADAHGPVAVLVDMDGRELHRWSHEFTAAFPDSTIHPAAEGVQYWRRVTLLEDGSLLALFEGSGLIHVDRDSRLLWSFDEAVHHDMEVVGDSLWVLTREVRPGSEASGGRPVTEDWVVVVALGGGVEHRVSIEEAIRRSDYRGLLDLTEGHGDLLHTNTLEVLDGTLDGRPDGRLSERMPAFRRGNVLLSFPKINTLAVLDMEREEIVWALTGLTRYQHDPTLLDSGRLLVLDNWGDRRGYSRLLEIDPSTASIGWRYEGSRFDFYTKCCGVNQRLANGNTLVAETDRGRAFEVTPDKQIVWEYLTPHRVGDADELVARLFEATRIDETEVSGWLGDRRDAIRSRRRDDVR